MDVHRAKPAKVVIRPQLQLLLRFSSPELAEKLTQKGLETSDSADATTTTPTYPQVRYIGGEIPEKFCYYASSDDEYPALLLSLPCPVETHKTFDNRILYKSGDISQVLVVYEKGTDVGEVVRGGLSTLDEEHFYPNGLTPPTERIVDRKYVKTRKTKGEFTPFEVREMCAKILLQTEHLSNTNAPWRDIVEEHEEVVPFEEWMIDPSSTDTDVKGITVTMKGHEWFDTVQGQTIMKHPEMLEVPPIECEKPKPPKVHITGNGNGSRGAERAANDDDDDDDDADYTDPADEAFDDDE